jgi:hypothetical protein
MNKLKINIVTIVSGLFLFNGAKAQKAVITETFNVSGNCGMCKKTIETAAKIKGVKNAQWSESGKVLTVTYDRTKTAPDQVLRNVAYAGYDNEKFLAPDAAYTKLHGCCQYERSQKAASAPGSHAGHGSADGPEKGTTPAQEAESGIMEVYNRYFALKEALVKSDPSLASAEATRLLAATGKVNMGALKGQEHERFMKMQNKLAEYSKAIAETKSLEKQRVAFSKLSGPVYDLMKAVSPGYEVYLDHCPMYNEGKGADWISREKPIRNPYYGSKMMTCGNVKDSLK